MGTLDWDDVGPWMFLAVLAFLLVVFGFWVFATKTPTHYYVEGNMGNPGVVCATSATPWAPDDKVFCHSDGFVLLRWIKEANATLPGGGK